jgi:enamine deaminase RidA (YjgF/YER057c/UK114 family)
VKILFLHGWQSVPGGTKPTFLQDRGHTVINPKLPDEDFEESLRLAEGEFAKHNPDVIVGSSRGGAVALNMNSGDAKLVLLCPAWKKFGAVRTAKPGTAIVHSRADDVVPFVDSEELVKNSGLPPWALTDIGSDHRLADPDPLHAMLQACIEVTLPEVPATAGTYVHAARTGNLLYLAGKGVHVSGKVGREFTKKQGYEFARQTGLILLAVLRDELGTLRRVKRVVKVLGMVNETADFGDHPFVINGCSDLFVEVFGEKGRHARSAVGMSSLPMGIPVEIEAIVEVSE